jgi:hypothetical protein
MPVGICQRELKAKVVKASYVEVSFAANEL